MTRALAIAALLTAAFAVAPGARADATGSVQSDVASCAAQVGSAGTGPNQCPDVVSVQLTVDPGDVGRPGATFIAILPLQNGQPPGYQGAYANPGGWAVKDTPEPYSTGPLPAGLNVNLPVASGICARASQYTQLTTFGVFAGYGRAPSASMGSSGAPDAQAAAALAQAESTGDQQLIAFVKQQLSSAGSAHASAMRTAVAAAQWMLAHHSVWQIASVNCQ